MSALGLRHFMETLFADLLGTYTYPGGATKPAISVDGPAPGVRATGLEVVIGSVPRATVASIAYMAGKSAVLEAYQVFLYQWSGRKLQTAQYRIAQVWPDSTFTSGPPVVRGAQVHSIQASISIAAGTGLSGLDPYTPPQVAHYLHTQSEPAEVWTINHNLGFYPAVEVYDAHMDSIEGFVEQLSLNQTRITFSVPMAGFARLS